MSILRTKPWLPLLLVVLALLFFILAYSLPSLFESSFWAAGASPPFSAPAVIVSASAPPPVPRMAAASKSAAPASPSIPLSDIGRALLLMLGVISMVSAFYLRAQSMSAQPAPPSPMRIALLNELAEVDRIPTDISIRLGKSKATVVEQLDGLVGSGLVERVARPGKKFVFYRLTHAGKTLLLRHRDRSASTPPAASGAA